MEQDTVAPVHLRLKQPTIDAIDEIAAELIGGVSRNQAVEYLLSLGVFQYRKTRGQQPEIPTVPGAHK